MSLNKQEVLFQLAEEVIYSAKGHFKTADWLRIAIACYIIVPLITSLLLLFFIFPELWQRLLSFFGLLFSSLALNSALNRNQDRANKIIERHMELGNKYLELYKQIRNFVADIQNVDYQKLQNIQNQVSQLDNQSKSVSINFVGRWWAKLTIKKEVDLEWIYRK